MSTQVLAPEALAQRRTIARNPFFAVMSAVILLLVLSGFTPTLYFRPLFKPRPIPGYLFLHGIVLTSWFVWFCVQSMLVQSGRTALHRRLGVVGGVLAAIVPFAGLMATAGAVGRVVASGISLDGDASVLGIGVSGPVVRFLSGVVWGNIASAVSFAILAWTGILLRRRIVTHKRLMLLATIAILGPALARLARLSIFGGEQGVFTPLVSLTLLAAVIVHDIATMRKIHPATLLGVLFPLGLFFICTRIGATDAGLAFVRWLQ